MIFDFSRTRCAALLFGVLFAFAAATLHPTARQGRSLAGGVLICVP
jgi:hypothetical protein